LNNIFTSKNAPMPTIYIDNQPYEVKEGKNLLEACLSLGQNLPYFCWHPALGSVGACRQCAVKIFKDETDTRGRIMMSCMEPVKDQIRLSITDTDARRFRASVIEWLMTNHPHDCAVCDEGGSCHLQDMTLMSGHNYRRFRFDKRTYHNQNLGPFLNHEMNRCIQCYRCVRFYRDYAGGKDLHVFAAHNHVYFGRHTDGTLENYFSGNLAEVCPTGVFTDKTYKQHYTRKWDLTSSPSICQHCATGCNTISAERYGTLRQITSRYNSEVNGYFLCDRGRFGYEFVNSTQRIRSIHARLHPHPLTAAQLAEHIHELRKQPGLIGIGSPRASLEANFSLKQLVGEENFYLGLSDTEYQLQQLSLRIMQEGGVPVPSVKTTEQCDAVFILSEDLMHTAPRYALAIRQAMLHTVAAPLQEKIGLLHWQDAAVREAVQETPGPLFIASSLPTALDEQARCTMLLPPDDIAKLGQDIALLLCGELPHQPAEHLLLEETLSALSAAKRPLIVAGYGSASESIIQAAYNIALALRQKGADAQLLLTLPESNSLGLAMLGGQKLQAAFDRASEGAVHTTIILENDLYRRAEHSQADRFFEQCKEVILLDHSVHATAEQATILVPAGSFAESDGTLVSCESRAQRYYQTFIPQGEIRESWRWLQQWQAESTINTFDRLVQQLEERHPVFEGITQLAPPSGFRLAGQKVPREPHRFSGRTAMQAQHNVSEPQPPDDPDSALSYTMEGYRGMPPAPLIPYFWSPGWNSVQAINKYQAEVGGPLHDGDPGKRLIQPAGTLDYFQLQPEPFAAMEGNLWLLPQYHIFGSEEWSMYTQGIAQRSPQPHIGLHPDDMQQWQLQEGQELCFETRQGAYALPVKTAPLAQRGLAEVPAGLPGMPFLNWPMWVRVCDVGQ